MLEEGCSLKMITTIIPVLSPRQ
ncbi:unnamed protein product [Spirodela intermedia]|uniref:Uncharacterized protein n=1 Tax=Spirodela intermedia TaxID=51605 RepID=A0A7I8KX76_SPIIN|nr:unnamed protein product [Spirodela intermedia]